MPHILIVEDDTDINNSTAEYLRRQGCICAQAFSGTEGLLLWREGAFERGPSLTAARPAAGLSSLRPDHLRPDLLLVDLMLPGLSGNELIAEVRKSSSVPIIVLSAKTELSDKVELLSSGADDYLTKPYQLEELWARILVQLRHASAAPTGTHLCYRDWVLDLDEMTLTAAGQPVNLTAHEFKIVELLAGRPKRVFTKQQIYEAVWEQDYVVEDKTITVHISNIRAKLRPSGTDGYIQTVWGIGFKLTET